MFDPLNNLLALRALHFASLAKAFVRHRNPRRRAAGNALRAFHQQMWRDAAADLGASFTDLGDGFYEIELDGRRTRAFERIAAIDNPVALEVAGNKPLTYRLLTQCGLPVPRSANFSYQSIGQAMKFLASVPVDCVVKPASGTGGGRGVTTGIRSRWQLAKAAAAAAVYGDELIIEEQMEGENYRLLYLDGQLIDAFVRRPPTLVADGRQTVRQAVHQCNLARLNRGSDLSQVLLTVDLDMKRTLAKQGFNFRSVPAKNTVVKVKTVVNENCAEDNESATDLLCDEIVDAGAKAARALQVRLAGVDIITRDPSRPLGDTGGAILEVNTTPNYYYHYRKRGGSCPVAAQVLRRLLIEDAAANMEARQEYV
jgi:D-alanine-D-alanine ligase-like ATP-grasp enzyme